jgi:hypothetical protein
LCSDTYFATVLGKMVTFNDSDIKIGYPSLDCDPAFESAVSPQQTETTWRAHVAVDRPSLMWGVIAHAHIARIVRKALRSMYLDPGASFDAATADDLARELQQYADRFPDHLRLRSSGELLPIYKRQASVIKLALQHAYLLVYRPSLPLSKLRLLGRDDALPLETDLDIRRCQDCCLEAAVTIADHASASLNQGEMSHQFWYARKLDLGTDSNV